MTYDRAWSEYLGEMHTTDADQYGTPAVFVGPETDPDAVIAYCRQRGAVFHEEPGEAPCLVVVLRPEVGPELYTEKALRRSMPRRLIFAEEESLRERGDLMHKPAEY